MQIKPTVIVQSATVEFDAPQLQELADSAAALEVVSNAYVEAGAGLANGHDERLAVIQDLQPLRKLAESVKDLLDGAVLAPKRKGGRPRRNPTSGA